MHELCVNVQWALRYGCSNPNYDMRTLINDIKTTMRGTVIVQAWCGSQGQYAWRLANMQHLTEAMADQIVLLRENLNRPS